MFNQHPTARAQDKIVSTFMQRNPKVTASIHDYQKVTDTLYKVIATLSTFKADSDAIRMAVSAAVGNEFSVVEGSFRQVVNSSNSTPAVVGFIRANHESMDLATASAQGFREVAKNIFMNDADESLWELNTVGEVKTLVRKSSDDLGTVMASVRLRAYNVPKLSQLEIAAIAPRMEYAAFVSPESESMKYGFILGAVDVEGDDDAEGADPAEQLEVMCSDKSIHRIPVTVLVESAFVGSEFKEIAAEEKWDLPANVDQKTYYGLLYGYSPEYVKMLDEQIDGHAAA